MRFLQQVEQFVRGEAVENPHSAIVMFNLASSMKWAHLPNSGGIYDQDPELLRRWGIIWQAQAERQRAEEKKREAEQRKRSASSGGGSRGRVAGRRR